MNRGDDETLDFGPHDLEINMYSNAVNHFLTSPNAWSNSLRVQQKKIEKTVAYPNKKIGMANAFLFNFVPIKMILHLNHLVCFVAPAREKVLSITHILVKFEASCVSEHPPALKHRN